MKDIVITLLEKKISKIYIEILKKCDFELIKTEEFTRKGWNNSWAYLNITCRNVENLEKLKNSKDIIEKNIIENFELGENEIGGHYQLRLKFKLNLASQCQNLDFKLTFEDIRDDILSNLKEAKYFIWVAMAWITNLEIIEVINSKAEEGINVQLIINDDEINNRKINNFSKNINLQIFKIPPKGVYGTNIMHNKFCIIDGIKVINGSYNWTKTADYHSENINIISSERSFSEQNILKYMDQFIEIKNKFNDKFW